jgi:hypothetical protein
MPASTPEIAPQNTARNDAAPLIQLTDGTPDGLAWWAEQYFRYAVTASPVSQQVQRRESCSFVVRHGSIHRVGPPWVSGSHHANTCGRVGYAIAFGHFHPSLPRS